MKCSRCGEECKENQAFCLKCGSPIQVVPDFNLIEAELANSVGELMDEIDEEDKVNKGAQRRYEDLDFLEDEHYDTRRKINYGNTKQNIELMDLDRAREAKKNSEFQVDGTKFDDTSNINIQPDDDEEDEEKRKKVFKIKVAIFSVIAVIIVVVAIVCISMLNKGGNSDSFNAKYNKAYDYFTAKDYDKALEEFLKVKNSATTKNQKIKVNKSILASYESLGDTTDEQIDTLKELIKLEPKNSEYYEKLLKLYDDNNMTEEMQKLVDSITNVTLQSKLSDYVVADPQFSEAGGSYDNNITLRLTTDKSNTIYYTLDGTKPDENSTKYTDEFQLQGGTTTVKAIAISSKGIKSGIVSNEYTVTLSEIDAPVIVPEGGTYTEDTEITINVPDDMKCYFVYGETAAVPTETDTLYTEPVKMLRGKNIFSAMFVSKDGTVSDVTQNIYQLNIERNITYNDALTLLQNFIVNNKIAVKSDDGQFVKTDGLLITFEYNTITDIDSNEYYIINAIENNSLGSKVTTTNYGIDTVTGSVVKLTADAANPGKYKLAE